MVDLVVFFRDIISQVIFVAMSTIVYNFATFCLKSYFVCVALLLIVHLDITFINLLLCCTTDVSLEFHTIYQTFCFAPLVSRFQWNVQCLFCIFYFRKIFDDLRIACRILFN